MIQKINFPSIIENENNGVLRVFELNKIPFSCKRVFSVVNHRTDTKRGDHAHKKCSQLICCVAGHVRIVCDNGIDKISYEMTPLNGAIFVPPGVWSKQNYIKKNSVLIVFCDKLYDESDYIRDYSEFLIFKGINL